MYVRCSVVLKICHRSVVDMKDEIIDMIKKINNRKYLLIIYSILKKIENKAD